MVGTNKKYSKKTLGGCCFVLTLKISYYIDLEKIGGWSILIKRKGGYHDKSRIGRNDGRRC
jgi:hypothetical protein